MRTGARLRESGAAPGSVIIAACGRKIEAVHKMTTVAESCSSGCFVRRVGSLALVFVTLLALSGCPPRDSIAKITSDSGRYAGKEVTIAGKVVDSYGALGRGMYEVNDGTGTLWVYSNGFGVPSNGLKVAVTGRIQQGFSFGGRSFTTILSETQPRH